MKDEGIWSGEHLYDTFHVLQNLYKKIKNKSITTELRKSLYAETVGEASKFIRNAQSVIENEG